MDFILEEVEKQPCDGGRNTVKILLTLTVKKSSRKQYSENSDIVVEPDHQKNLSNYDKPTKTENRTTENFNNDNLILVNEKIKQDKAITVKIDLSGKYEIQTFTLEPFDNVEKMGGVSKGCTCDDSILKENVGQISIQDTMACLVLTQNNFLSPTVYKLVDSENYTEDRGKTSVKTNSKNSFSIINKNHAEEN
ncbi:hypothetical protein NQ317_008826 [Molorchus minor]|uniref:Uncharacterized protein n=1 Tax=Molorchus minor TaxID=1323400 RepID=A0ABQ9JUE2_9CUCU|nr:hypothetical protein NQ317_008826 [Molorchus minor]